MTKDEFKGPSMSGTFTGYQPQWRHRGEVNEVLNKRLFDCGDGKGKDWTNISYTTIRGGLAIRLPDGTEVPLGVPFPRWQPGILETIFLCGEEQALALGWMFSAHVAALGGEIEVRAEEYSIKYEIKAEKTDGKKVE